MKSLNYKDIYLVPNYSELVSRALANTCVNIGKYNFKIPVMPSNMASCINFEKARWMANNGYFYILHRFYEYDEIFNWVASADFFTSISVGIQKRDYELIERFIAENKHPDFITLDVAHGDHSEVYKMLGYLKQYKKNHNSDLFLIGGNVATSAAFCRMSSYCDAIKVGIAYGKACRTYHKTGFASPMFSTVKEISHKSCNMEKAPLIIADGGISNNGDIAKALVAGADLVMCGSVFATCIDSPATVDPTDPTKKLYFGSASKLNGNLKNIEGTTIALPMNGMTYQDKLTEIKQDLSSSISYAGGNDLHIFKEVQYGIV